MKKHQEEVSRLLKVLQQPESTRSVYLDRINNHAVRAHFSKETLYFEHNIGGIKRPTKAEASVLLEGLADYYQELCEDSNDLTTSLEGKSFVAELVVFSGHMDFKIASLKDGVITWDTELE